MKPGNNISKVVLKAIKAWNITIIFTISSPQHGRGVKGKMIRGAPQLLQQAHSMIDLPTERIISGYSQWQSTFMLKTIPNIKFVKGIPSDLEHDFYLKMH